MIKRIDSRDVLIGMYVTGFEGSWLDHPFWRKRFPVRTEEEAAAIRASGVAVLIDVTRGVAPAAPGPAPASGPVPPAEPPPEGPPPERGPPARLRRVPLLRLGSGPEVERAQETVRRSRKAVERMFADVRLGRAVDARQAGLLADEIAESVARDAGALLRVTRLKKKHEYTYMHSVAVGALMISLARALGLPPEEVRELGVAGLLHDIGKMGVPDTILDKPAGLDPDEYRIVRDHPRLGHRLLGRSAGLSPIVLDVCLHHHERVDGSGYPFGLAAGRLSLHARMAAVCDVYDAVTSERAYKGGWSPTDALSRMRDWDGHFDPAILDAFVRGIGIYPRGTLVRLADGLLAMVVDGNDVDPTLPLVRPFYDGIDRDFVAPRDVWSGRDRARIVGVEDGERWFGADWPSVLALVARGERPPAALNRHAGTVVRILPRSA